MKLDPQVEEVLEGWVAEKLAKRGAEWETTEDRMAELESQDDPGVI